MYQNIWARTEIVTRRKFIALKTLLTKWKNKNIFLAQKSKKEQDKPEESNKKEIIKIKGVIN